MCFRKRKKDLKNVTPAKMERKLQKLEDSGSVSSFTQRLRETWRKQNLG